VRASGAARSLQTKKIVVTSRRAHLRVRPKPGESIEVQLIGTDFLDILEVRDISSGGLGLQVPPSFEAGDLAEQVDVIIKLPRERPFSARGLIRHVTQGNLFGLEFTQLPDQARSRIEKYIAARIAEGAGTSAGLVGA
jgi:hypothetical protein